MNEKSHCSQNSGFFALTARFNPGLLAKRTRMAGFRTEIRAIGPAAADRAYARIQARLPANA